MKKQKTFLFVFIALWSRAIFGQADLQQIYTESKEAYDAGDYKTFLDKTLQANTIRPNHPTLLYNLAAAYALNKKNDKSVEALRKAVWMNAGLPFQEDKDFEELKDDILHKDLIKEVEDLNSVLRTGDVAFEVNDKLLHPEGVAYSEKTGKFYIGSVHKRKILEFSEEKGVGEFASGDSLNAIMGLQVDDKNNKLWVCSTPIPEMMGNHEGKTAKVLGFDLESGTLLESYSAPHDNAWLGDLTVSREGAVYVSNSNPEQPMVYTVEKDKEQLEVLFKAPQLISLQGLTLNAGETTLFIADYREGIFAYDFEKDKLSEIKYNLQNPLKGIDGLYYHQGNLIAVHNGLRPFRIVKYQLTESEEEISSFEFLEKALPEMNEPTLGVMVGNHLYYIANSPWGAYYEEKELKPSETTNPIIRRVDVSKD
nr:L-dopachrome tautomerase-related protein [Allomuricauda sp.]